LLIDSAGWAAKTFASAEAFLSCPAAPGPSCLVLDVTLPNLDGLELQKRVGADRVDMPIIFISGYGDVPMTVQAMKAGAMEFLTKPLVVEALLNAIRNAIERSATVLAEAEASRSLRECHASLTCREREVMEWVVSGLLNKQIGAELDISEITVKAHRGSMMRKMRANSLAQLVNMAAKLGIAPRDPIERGRYAVRTLQDRRGARATTHPTDRWIADHPNVKAYASTSGSRNSISNV
jgi:FixJ family two-component response regulator